MKKLILKILAQKKLALIIIAILMAMIIASVYVLMGIQENLEKMATPSETVTYFPPYPAIQTTAKNAEQIKRGEYLTKAGDCIACHTNTAEKEKSKPFAGGLIMQTPFGAIYTPNITPDKETGIGNWTEAQFIKAMTEGISPEGHFYYPAFPYLYFKKMSLEDLKAIKAYLDVIPAVKLKNKDNDMVWPFNWRFMQFGWRLLFFDKEKLGPQKINPTQSLQWNRGAYLAEGLGHCAMCHSPSYHLFDDSLSLGAPIREYDLTGAKIQGYLAPNITSSNFNKASIQEVVDVFSKDRLVGGGKVEGPMLEVNHNSLRYLTESDLIAIATYLKAVQSKSPPMPKAGAGGFGKAVYDSYCSGCHASGAGGAPKYADPASWDAVLKEPMETVYQNAIQGKGSMPAKGTCLSCGDGQIKEAVDYMIESIKGKKAVFAPQKPRKLTLEEGKQIYLANCAICHDNGFKHAPKPGDIEAWKPMVNAGFIPTFENVLMGRNGHPPHGACPECSDAELKAAVKYMLQQSSTTKDFSLW